MTGYCSAPQNKGDLIKKHFTITILALTIIAAALVLMCCNGLSDNSNAADDEFEVDGIMYEITSENEVRVTDNKPIYKGDLVIPSSVTHESKTYTVTAIFGTAFFQCKELTSVVLPETITLIDDGAFSQCSALTSITIPAGVTTVGYSTFSDCTSLETVILPDTITLIDMYAFYNCSSLSSIEIPSGVTSIENYAFKNCRELPSIVLPDSLTALKNGAFSGCSSLLTMCIPKNVATIGDSTFASCSSLLSIDVDDENANFCSVDGVLFSKDQTELIQYPAGKFDESFEIPSGTSIIDEKAFMGCKHLRDVTLPSGIAEISVYAFSGCASLASITIPDSVTIIQPNAFESCASLASITIPDSVTDIGGGAFALCSSLTSVTLPSGLTMICSNLFVGCSSLTSVTIPEGTTSIENAAFQGCRSLTSVSIPNTINEIGDYVFSDCTSLVSVTIPDSVETIGKNVFQYCTSLETVTIGKGLATLGNYPFYFCESLETITVDEENTHFASQDGVLFNAGKTELIKYPASKTDESYIIPDSVTDLNSNAFFQCQYIESVTFGKNLSYLTGSTFESCISLAEIVVPNENTDFDSENGILFDEGKTVLWKYPSSKTGESYSVPGTVGKIEYMAFQNCTSLVSITIPDSVNEIGLYVFNGCTSLTTINVASENTNYCSVDGVLFTKDMLKLMDYPAGKTTESYEIPAGVKTIDTYAFYMCDYLVSVTIPSSVTSIDVLIFNRCPSLTTFNVSEDNTKYSSKDGVLFDKNMTKLVQYPTGKTDDSYEIPYGVNEIGMYAFVDCEYLKSLTIPASVYKFNRYSITECKELKTLVLDACRLDWSEFMFEKGLEKISIDENADGILYILSNYEFCNKDGSKINYADLTGHDYKANSEGKMIMDTGKSETEDLNILLVVGIAIVLIGFAVASFFIVRMK